MALALTIFADGAKSAGWVASRRVLDAASAIAGVSGPAGRVATGEALAEPVEPAAPVSIGAPEHLTGRGAPAGVGDPGPARLARRALATLGLCSSKKVFSFYD